MRTFVRILLIWASLTACESAPEFFPADAYPERLSSWGLVYPDLGFAGAGVEYDLNTALFSDYAHKQRILYLPEGGTAEFAAFDAFEFPTGTIVSKTFYYPADDQGRVQLSEQVSSAQVRVIETRLLVKQASGWDALPYVWRGDDAYLAITGDLLRLQTTRGEPLHYLIPSKNQCASCHATNHTTGAIQPIGLKARHLHRPAPGGEENQLEMLARMGWLTGLPGLTGIEANAVFANEQETIVHRARSYLDINCGHCHNPEGAADTSGLLLDYQPHDPGLLGRCKPPIAAGRGSGGLNYSIVPGQADLSILSFRMASEDPAVMMPELGRSLAHTQGVQLIRDWINGMPGECR